MKNYEVKTLDEIRREHILKVLYEADWDIEKASNILNVSIAYLKKKKKKIKDIEYIKNLK